MHCFQDGRTAWRGGPTSVYPPAMGAAQRSLRFGARAGQTPLSEAFPDALGSAWRVWDAPEATAPLRGRTLCCGRPGLGAPVGHFPGSGPPHCPGRRQGQACAGLRATSLPRPGPFPWGMATLGLGPGALCPRGCWAPQVPITCNSRGGLGWGREGISEWAGARPSRSSQAPGRSCAEVRDPWAPSSPRLPCLGQQGSGKAGPRWGSCGPDDLWEAPRWEGAPTPQTGLSGPLGRPPLDLTVPGVLDG